MNFDTKGPLNMYKIQHTIKIPFLRRHKANISDPVMLKRRRKCPKERKIREVTKQLMETNIT